MDALALARWQFGITTVYHFLLVPLTIGLSVLVAYMQVKAYRSNSPHWERLTDFFGKILVINFALGVATGIVQEFQFGMNWSAYSKMVGDIFGAPLAFEALLAFFLESTFLGIWIFGKGRIPKSLHSLSVCLFAIGTNISAYFIVAANSFMQYPVGAKFNPTTGRAELDGFGGFLKVLFNEQSVWAFVHTVSASFVVSGTLVAGLSMYWLVRSNREGREIEAREYWKPSTRFGFIVTIVAGIIVALSGHFMGQHLAVTQPMKMAAAEALCHTEKGAGFTVAAFGDFNGNCENGTHLITIPGLYSFMATNDFGAEMKGLNELNKEMQTKMKELYGDRVDPNYDYRPNVMVSFWTFRLMIALGMLSTVVGIIGLIMLRGNRLTDKGWFAKVGLWMTGLPYLACTFGWIFTEMGRQPWIVHPNFTQGADPKVSMLTDWGVSHVVQGWEVLATMVVFTLLYAALGVVWFWLIRRYTLEGINTDSKLVADKVDANAPFTFSY